MEMVYEVMHGHGHFSFFPLSGTYLRKQGVEWSRRKDARRHASDASHAIRPMEATDDICCLSAGCWRRERRRKGWDGGWGWGWGWTDHLERPPVHHLQSPSPYGSARLCPVDATRSRLASGRVRCCSSRSVWKEVPASAVTLPPLALHWLSFTMWRAKTDSLTTSKKQVSSHSHLHNSNDRD